MFDQAPLEENRVTLDPTYTDGLGLPRPHIEYGLDPYTMEGFRVAADVCTKVYERMGAVEFTKTGVGGTGDFTYKVQREGLSLLRRRARHGDPPDGNRPVHVRRRREPVLARRT